MSIGYHVSKNGDGNKNSMAESLQKAVDNLQSYNFNKLAAQIFVTGPQNFKENLSENEKTMCAQIVRDNHLQLVIHGAYVDNPWTRTFASIQNIKKELKIAFEIGATGVVVHLSAGAFDFENLKYVLQELSTIEPNVKDNVILWLEIHTAKPSLYTYETPDKLHNLFDKIIKIDLQGLRIGLCIDTAHLYSCGTSFSSYLTTQDWLNQLPPNIPIMCHLNDSASKLGSGIDRHQNLMQGEIWSQYHPITGSLPAEESGLIALLNWAEKTDTVLILERNKEGIINDLNLLRSLKYFQN